MKWRVQLDRLGAAIRVSNFARQAFESRHNLKYWTRQPYLGLGGCAFRALVRRERSRTIHPGLVEDVAERPLNRTPITSHAALEKRSFGLRLNAADLKELLRNLGHRQSPSSLKPPNL
jgi:coproporphyrinogen III oxidase-like Fe-S oxidoreductase